MTKKKCEVCGNILFSINNVCLDCKSWGKLLNSLLHMGVGPVTIADLLYERLVYKLENNETYYENILFQEYDEELLEVIIPFTFWRMEKAEVAEIENN